MDSQKFDTKNSEELLLCQKVRAIKVRQKFSFLEKYMLRLMN